LARVPDARAEQARKLYREGRKTAEISELLGVPEGTVRSWKKRYGWDSVALQKKGGSVAKEKGSVAKEKCSRKRGGQSGNQNASGHGGTGPPGNRNAVTTGEFESLFFDTMEPEEKELLGMVQPEKGTLLLQEIRLLTVRERRMLKRIAALSGQEGAAADDPDALGAIQGRQQDIEEALTRVQNQKQKAIDSLHRYGYDDARLELEGMKLELALQKLGGQEEEAGDDGFMEAMNAAAAQAWRDGE